MPYEFSAGGVVYKEERKKVFILVCQHSQHHGWVFPKGLIGDKEEFKGEKKEETALREVQEETGIKGKILLPLTPIEYLYTMDGIKRNKTVYYFLMESLGGNIQDHDWEMENVLWLPKEDVSKLLTFPSDKTVWKEAEIKIKKLVKE